jgi:tellurite resistance protein
MRDPERAQRLLAQLSGLPSFDALKRTVRGVSAEEGAPEPSPREEQLTALLEAAFLVSASDGEFAPIERDGLSSLLAAMTDGLFPLPSFEELLHSFAGALSRDGYLVRIEHLAETLRDGEMRHAALLLAVGACLADGEIHDKERALLETLADAFELDPEEISTLLAEANRAF